MAVRRHADIHCKGANFAVGNFVEFDLFVAIHDGRIYGRIFQSDRSSLDDPVPLRNIITLAIVIAICTACAIQARNLRYGGKVGQAIRMIEDYYIDEVDSEELYIAAMKGVVSKLDQFSDFIPPQHYHDFQSTIEQRFGGVGINIEGPPAANRLTVISPIPGTPAFRAGIQPGDVILAINGQSTEGLEASKATSIMRGPVGTKVRLLVRRANTLENLEIEIPRAEIEINSVFGDRIQSDGSWDYFIEEDNRLAYIRITMFGERTVEEFRKALHAIRDRAQAVIIDLRDNPGGILPASVDMCDMLVDEGVLLRTKGRRDIFDNSFVADSAMELPKNIPIVVLVNGESASASEIMAGCLQDLCRASIAGSRSYGKGTVQQIFELESDTTALKFTTARFLRPSGKNIHRTDKMNDNDEWGITPTPGLAVPMTELEEAYLRRRWFMRGDPRAILQTERPPVPEFAGDQQLAATVRFLQQSLSKPEPDASSVETKPAESDSTPTKTEAGDLKTEERPR